MPKFLTSGNLLPLIIYFFQFFSLSLTDDEMALISGMDKNKRIVVPMCNGKMRDEKSIHFPFAIEF